MCSDCHPAAHDVWGQIYYVGTTEQFRILWQFSSPKTLAARFQYAWQTGEPVTWTVTLPSGSQSTITGTWRYSNNAGGSGMLFTSASGSRFAQDDGCWGAGPGVVDGNTWGATAGTPTYGHCNLNSGDSTCSTLYTNGVTSTQSSLNTRLYVGGFPGAPSWIHFAHWGSSSNPVYAAAPTGTPNTAGNDFALGCMGYGVGTVFKVVMGSVNDYFRVRSGYTLCTTLGSYTGHEFSNDQGLTWVTPSHNPSLLGGSTAWWPLNNVAGDSRAYLSFWGGHPNPNMGGCCSYSVAVHETWNRAFDIYVLG